MEVRKDSISFSATLEPGYRLKRDSKQYTQVMGQVDLAREAIANLPNKKFIFDHDNDIAETYTLKQKGLFKKKKYLIPKYENLNEIRNWIVDTVKAATEEKLVKKIGKALVKRGKEFIKEIHS